MGVRVLRGNNEGDSNGYSCLYCSTTMWAFGGIFNEDEEPEDFLKWLQENTGIDPRKFTDKEMEIKMAEWRTINNEQKASEL